MCFRGEAGENSTVFLLSADYINDLSYEIYATGQLKGLCRSVISRDAVKCTLKTDKKDGKA
jgi:hypothetical protein